MLPSFDESWDRVRDHFEHPVGRGRAVSPTHCAQDSNPLCGDVVRIELALDERDVIVEARFEGRGCCVSQAAASLLIEWAEGKTRAEARSFSEAEMFALVGVPLTLGRRPCCLLAWRVLKAALGSEKNHRLDA